MNAFSFVGRKFIVHLSVVWTGRVTENGSQRRKQHLFGETRQVTKMHSFFFVYHFNLFRHGIFHTLQWRCLSNCNFRCFRCSKALADFMITFYVYCLSLNSIENNLNEITRFYFFTNTDGTKERLDIEKLVSHLETLCYDLNKAFVNPVSGSCVCVCV